MSINEERERSVDWKYYLKTDIIKKRHTRN
jgi:hypothetical protein